MPSTPPPAAGAPHEERLRRALESLHGLATGDAFGERFFVDGTTRRPAARSRELRR